MSLHIVGPNGEPVCPEWAERDAMTEAEYWEYVARALGAHVPEDDDPWGEEPTYTETKLCGICGEAGACGYDSEGRALIHSERDEND